MNLDKSLKFTAFMTNVLRSMVRLMSENTALMYLTTCPFL